MMVCIQPLKGKSFYSGAATNNMYKLSEKNEVKSFFIKMFQLKSAKVQAMTVKWLLFVRILLSIKIHEVLEAKQCATHASQLTCNNAAYALHQLNFLSIFQIISKRFFIV